MRAHFVAALDRIEASLPESFRAPINGGIGLASAACSWIVGSMEAVQAVFQFVGVVAGSLAAVVSLMIAYRQWRRGETPKRKGKGE